MEEQESLLYGNYQSQGNQLRGRPGIQNGHTTPARDLSSDDSDEWWDESQSICSSCCDIHSASSFEWEKEIDSKGQLFYIESDFTDVTDTQGPNDFEKTENIEKTDKVENVKKGRLLNWVRRKESKKLHQSKHSQHNSNEESNEKISDQKNNAEEELKQVILNVRVLGSGSTISEKLLGLSLGATNENAVVVTSIIPDSVADFSHEFAPGDVIHKINSYNVTPQNIETILESLVLPLNVILKVEKTTDPVTVKEEKFQSPFVQALLRRNHDLDSILLDKPVGVVVVDVESQILNKDDVIYCYPEKCTLSSCRGAFVTLYHLLAEIRPNDTCQSSSIVMKNQPTYVMYSSDENFLLLVAIPQSKCTLKEATFIMNDLVRNLAFSHQTVKKCFETSDKYSLDNFFSMFFCRILSNGFSSDAFQFAFLDEATIKAEESGCPQFEDVLPFANWVPLPKEAQVQIDEALNELEANDFDDEEEDSIENQRIFSILGSAFFHKGFLLASHLPKEDLVDVYAFHRQNCLIQLVRNEPVKLLIVWREVFPKSVNRGLPNRKPSSYIVPTGRWFMLIVGLGHDLLTVILEAGEFCAKLEGNPGPSVPYVEEAEDTLRHMQKLGISTLASQWIESNSRFRTTTPEEIFAKLSTRRKDNLLGFVKALDGSTKPSVGLKASSAGLKSNDPNQGRKGRNAAQETSEDSVSQTASNVSEVSDENAPILGRRAERGRNVPDQNLSEDSDSSESDWDSSRDSNMRESISSSAIDNFYLCSVGEILPARLTTGPEDILFHYVQMDGNEGVLVNAAMNKKRQSPKMSEILENFRRTCQIIHSILENNVHFKNNCQDSSKSLISKSLVAVKEHGVLFECFSNELDSNKKPISFNYWIVGRLFFSPQPREIYVCYHDEAPQNLVELAFRLGLSIAG